MVSLGLVVAQFDKDRPVTQEMAEAAREAAAERGAEIVETLEVPGSYDSPLASQFGEASPWKGGGGKWPRAGGEGAGVGHRATRLDASRTLVAVATRKASLRQVTIVRRH